jgi:acyl-CoA thioester hydrolase
LNDSPSPAQRPVAPTRAQFRQFRRLTTRWRDNDAYGHVNNVVYYEWFDTVVNAYLIESGALDIATSPVVGYVVETRCVYFAPLNYPQPVDIGLAVVRMGRSSVHYALGVFAADAQTAAAAGSFVHVYVDRVTHKPVALPQALAAALNRLQSDAQ